MKLSVLVALPLVSACFRICFAQEIDNINEEDIETAAAFGVQFCSAGGVEIIPSLSSVIPSSTVPRDAGPSGVAGDGMSTVAASSVSVVAPTSDMVPAESSSATPASTSSAPYATALSVVASSIKSSVSSVAGSAPSAAATASQTNAAGALIAPSTGFLAGVLAVVLAM
ncbi:hypothetical protein QFC20_006797 [Naganishia adeliensis]|uniref:Uncharacterized protein n=1 Tax=Naganishia adeliensis TaxID=92952 RepID=A0ACC2V8A8_9TREE|nr:hypothetical protein QFC20_006797 [Naganishia adeliensis]